MNKDKKTQIYYATPPVTNEYFTRGKMYLFIRLDEFYDDFMTLDDNKDVQYCTMKQCKELNGRDWIKIKYPVLYLSITNPSLSLKWYLGWSIFELFVMFFVCMTFRNQTFQLVPFSIDIVCAIYFVTCFFNKLGQQPFFKE